MISLLQQLIGTISFASDSVSKTYGNGAFTNALTNTGDGVVSYASSNTSVATVNSAGQVTIVGAGSATITATVTDSARYHYPVSSVSYTLDVAKASISPTVSMQGWTYGETSTDPIVSGNTGGGSVICEYKVSTAGDNTYTSTKPTNAGTYTVRATIAATTNYNGATATADFSIAKANPTYTAPTYSSLTYNGSAQNLVSAGSSNHGTFTYSTSKSGTYSSNIPKGTNAGTYNVWWKFTGDANHNDVAATQVSGVSIAQKALTVTAKAQTISYGGSIATGTGQVTTSGLVSGDSLTAVTLTPSGSGVTTTGTITPSAASTSKGAANYDITYVDGNLTITAVPASVTAAPTAKTSLKYNGSGQALVNAGTASGGTMMYKSTTSNSKPSSTSGFSATVPTGTSVGTYYVWYYVQGDSNHTDTAISSTAISVSIGQGTGVLSFASSSAVATKTPSIYGLTVSVANCGWEKTTAKTLTGFNIFRSFSNKGMATSSSVMKLQFVNNTGAAITTTIKVGPYCENTYDFVYVAAWNASDVSPTSSSVPTDALYNGKSATAEWTDVEITIPTGTNTLQIVYRKDSSVDKSPDCGYVALPFDVAMGSITNGLKKTGNGTVTYSSSNTSVATVNSSTGAVTIVGTGTATITASMTATTQYSGATATYTITVSTSADCTEALTVTLSKDAGSASISSATVALKTGSTTLATLSSGDTVNIAWGLEYTLSAADIDGFFPPADVTKDWSDTSSKSVTMQYTYIPYKVVVQSGSVVTSNGTKVVVNI